MFFTSEDFKEPFWATGSSGRVVISIVIVFIADVIAVTDLVSKKGGAMQKANVSRGKTKMDKR
jgi:hypothetical protein